MGKVFFVFKDKNNAKLFFLVGYLLQ